MLTLHEAVKSGRLVEFIVQEEGRGIGPIALSKMNAGIAALINDRQNPRRTDGIASDISSEPGLQCAVHGQRTFV